MPKNMIPIDDRSRLEQELLQREAELDLINSVQLALASRLEVQAIYDLVGDRIRDIFDAQIVMISTYDTATHMMEHRYAIERGQRVYAPGQHVVGGFRSQIVKTRRPVLVGKNVALEAERLGQPTLPGTITPKTWLGVPMLVGDQVTGILSLQDVDHENAYRDSDVRLLQTLAASMSVALENARLWEQEKLYRKTLEREFEIGREIQAGFLPETIPQPPGWEIAAALLPAREVAGDFYDVFELPEGKLGVVIADVCDKGLGAALFMTLFRSLLRAAASMDIFTRTYKEAENSVPVRLQNAISFTNNYIAEAHGNASMFATIFFGILDPVAGTLTYINGGHLPPLLIGRQGIKSVLPVTGPAVGAISNSIFTVNQVAFARNDVFFAYTDGLTDTPNPAGEFFSIDAVISQFKQNRSLATCLQRIEQQLETYAAGAKQTDDITMLMIRRV